MTERPAPVIHPETQFFWDAAREGRLALPAPHPARRGCSGLVADGGYYTGGTEGAEKIPDIPFKRLAGLGKSGGKVCARLPLPHHRFWIPSGRRLEASGVRP